MSSNRNRDEDVYEIIAANIKSCRKKANITQGQLATKSHYSHEFIRRIESSNGKKYFSLNTLVKIADALEVRVEELLKGINNDE